MALVAAACGADGLIIEVNNDPPHALCDGAQSLRPEQFEDVAKAVRRCRRRPGRGLTGGVLDMKVGIAGLGLIGGSLAKAYEKSGAAAYGYDGNRVVQDYAKLQGTLTGDLDRETIGDCDLLLVALYPQVSIDYLKEMAPYICQGHPGHGPLRA